MASAAAEARGSCGKDRHALWKWIILLHGNRNSEISNSNSNSNSGSNDGCSVFVGNLKYETKWQGLKDHMRQAGNVDSANILEAPNGRSKGCAIVKYQNPREAQRAIQDLNESELEGRTIFVQPDNGNQRENRDQDFSNSNSNYNNRASDSPPHSAEYGVFVGNLPFECSWQALKDFFKSCGPIDRAEVVEDPKTGRKKGFGMLYFATERAMNNAINKFDGRDFQGRTLEVRKDKKSLNSQGDNNISNEGTSTRSGFRIFVGNLDFDCSWKEVKDLVQRRCGRVEHADIPKRGWGIVTFATHRDGAEAISRLDGIIFNNRKLEVRWDRDSSGKDHQRRNSPSSSSAKQLYVGNLPYDCTWQNLKDAFKSFGIVSHAEVCETANGRTTGFGIVAFTNPTSTERALNAMDGTDFQGRKLSVRFDRKPEKLEAEKSGNPKNSKRDSRVRNPRKGANAKESQNNDNKGNGNGNDNDNDTEMAENRLDMALSSAR
mmetsp:Transcript_13828/g.29051  ORF Transcript_13828/g.29051 Transcript_13828/m.29051 type:complete len:490 (-) Transcript_13828:205-1674(-)